MKARSISLLFGVTFIAVGILGFTPNALVGYEGYFVVNAMHNLVHILTGSVFLFGAIRYPAHAGRVLKIVGVAYVAVTILGFLTTGNMLLGMVHINEADRWLHLGLAIAILASGFVASDNKPRLPAHTADIQ